MKKVGVIFGGKSTEHDVSIASGTSVIKHLDKENYKIFPIYIDKNGIWYKYNNSDNENNNMLVESKIYINEKIENISEYLKQLDVVFPVLHGLYGEDGTIQGLFEILGIPYVGCKVLASCIAMDKVYTKIIIDKAKINQAKYIYVKKYNEEYIHIDNEFNEKKYSLESIANLVKQTLGFPVFVKPSNSGSSVGVNKAKNAEELQHYIEYASKYDTKILIEENINGHEIECAILGNENVNSSCLGEILPAEEFYSFSAKYKNTNSNLYIPAKLSPQLSKTIKELAVKAFKAIDGKGLARIDFFVDKNSNKIYLNEINTLPGFTSISMYPKLWEQSGFSYSKLLDKLIELAMEIEKKEYL